MLDDILKRNFTQRTKSPSPLCAVSDHSIDFLNSALIKVARVFHSKGPTVVAEFAFGEVPFHIGAFPTLQHVCAQIFSTFWTPL